jgi:MYXO-CTERM domain-containing protein
MIGTLLRFFFLRVIGGRGAMVLAVLAFIFGRRRRDTTARGYRRIPRAGTRTSTGTRTATGPEDRTTAR